MEGFVAGRHFLNEIVPDRVATCDLRHELRRVRVEVLDDRLLARLIVDDGGADFSLERHGHSHGGSLRLLGVLRVELLLLDGRLVHGAGRIVENDNAHGVLELSGILERDLEAAFAELVLRSLASSVKLRGESLVLGMVGNDLSALLGDLVGSTRSLNLEINLLAVVGSGLVEALFSDGSGVLLLLGAGLQLTDLNVGVDRGRALSKILNRGSCWLSLLRSRCRSSLLGGRLGLESLSLCDQFTLGGLKLFLGLLADGSRLRYRLCLGFLLLFLVLFSSKGSGSLKNLLISLLDCRLSLGVILSRLSGVRSRLRLLGSFSEGFLRGSSGGLIRNTAGNISLHILLRVISLADGLRFQLR